MNFQVNHGCAGCRMNAPEPRNLLILYHWCWQATKRTISDYWSVTLKDDLLEYLGYVPGSICTSIEHISPELELPGLKRFLKTTVRAMIREDYARASEEGWQTVYYRVLAIMANDKIVDLDRVRMSPVVFPWTLLKSSDPITVLSVSPVSPLVKQFIEFDNDAFMYHVSMDFSICFQTRALCSSRKTYNKPCGFAPERDYKHAVLINIIIICGEERLKF